MDNTHEDYFFNEEVVLPFSRVFEWQKAIYIKLGMDEKDAATVADSLTIADARGVYSHGIMRTPIYAERIRCGGTSATAKPEIIKEFGATALVDAHNAMGQVAGVYSMNKAIELAKQYGTSAVSVTGSNHIGTCAYYAQMASKENMVGICWTINGGNNMAPWGGAVAQLGNNPYAMAVPCLTKPDVVMDMATSVVARGKVVMARKTHSKIPLSWALDKEGNPTDDPEKAYWGTVQPFGGYKGYAITFFNAILAAILNGSYFGDDVTEFYELPGVIQNTGHLMQVINIDAIDDSIEFRKRMDRAVDYLKGGKKAPGVKEIFVPGEMEAIAMERQLKEGITYPTEIIRENIQLSEKLGLHETII